MLGETCKLTLILGGVYLIVRKVIDWRIPVFFMDKKESIPVEIQLRTLAMDFWASLEHDLKYKAVSEVQGIDASSELKDCSRIIEEVESRMQVLAGTLEPEG